MTSETRICGCAASSWTKTFAWIQIVIYILFLVYVIVGLICASITYLIVRDAILPFASGVLGLRMGITLLNGTEKKRVGCLIAWNIYVGVCIAGYIMYVFVLVHDMPGLFDIIDIIIGGTLVLVLVNVFIMVVVYILIKDIRKGVFDVHPNPNMNESRQM